MTTKTKENILTILSVIVIPIIITFSGYFLIGFLTWISNDPLDLFEDGPNWFVLGSSSQGDTRTPEELKWDNCVDNTKYLYDQFNDTSMTTYGTDDKPATEAQNFMRLCLEKS